jgi:predicted ATP-binding protein involved in virulence
MRQPSLFFFLLVLFMLLAIGMLANNASVAWMFGLLAAACLFCIIWSFRKRDATNAAPTELDEMRERRFARVMSEAASNREWPAAPPRHDEIQSSVLVQESSQAINVPAVPEELLSAFSTGSCVLFAGGGISAQAGVPLWNDGWSRVLEEAVKENPSKNWDNLRNALKKGEIVALVDLLRGRLSHEDLVRFCGQVFSAQSPRQPTLYHLIRDIPFGGVLTTAWDKSLEDALRRRRPTVLIASDSDLFGQVLREKQFYLLKLNGDLSRPETLLFTVEDYRRAIYEREQFSQFSGSVVSSNTILFVGTSLTTIDDFFSCMRASQGARRHFALVPKQSNLDFESERFLSRYGVQLLGYNATVGHPEVERFISDLYDQILKRPELRDAIRFESGTLDRVLLQNIGPFRQLDLEIRSSWNVLLGNNGCGKSSILKAIALGLCGDDASARQVAAKLLNSKADKGSVELCFGNQKFVTTLIREGRKVVVKSEQLTPFRTGRWLVLGFPALRGVSQHSPAGPNDKAGMANPDISDLLPLIDGAVDARLDSIKQWIINTYLRSELVDKQNKSINKGKQLLESFFKVLGDLTPEVECRFKSVDSSTWEVIVTTDDGDVPIDYISQGTSSIFGWVGILLQRLYEVFPNTPDPEKQHALVLADEIDAHMHPAWQQSLLSALGRIFPSVQFITTTHSPLIVGGLKAENVFRFARDDDGRVVRLEIDPDMTMGRADQILTTPLFGLNTTLDTETQATVERYRNLLGKSNRTISEEEEFQDLRGTLQFRIPPPHVDLEERRAAVRERDALVREAREKLGES